METAHVFTETSRQEPRRRAMLEFKKFLTSMGGIARARQDVDSTYPGDVHDEGLEVEYEALVARQFRRLGVDRSCVSIEVRRKGEGADGLGIFVAMIQIASWERISVLRLLLGLPMLEGKVRQAASATWLADVSHFGGVWLNASQELRDSEAIGDLRELMIQVAPPRRMPRRETDAGPDSESSPTTQPEARDDAVMRL
jgi:hypothetical protein